MNGVRIHLPVSKQACVAVVENLHLVLFNNAPRFLSLQKQLLSPILVSKMISAPSKAAVVASTVLPQVPSVASLQVLAVYLPQKASVVAVVVVKVFRSTRITKNSFLL